MKITFVLPAINMAGGTRVVAIYARALSEMGHDVVIVTPQPEVPSLKSKLKSFLKGNGWGRPPLQEKSYFDDLGIAHCIVKNPKILQDEDVPDADVVIATWWETAEWVSRFAVSKGAKVYFIQHHEIFEYLPVERAHATYRLPLHKIVIAKWLMNVMNRDYGDSNVDLVPNSVNIQQFYSLPRLKQTRPTVGFLFHTTPFKGVDVALRALKLIKDAVPNVRIVSFGAHAPNKVSGWLNEIEFELLPAQDRLREIYAMCDVWITASHSEGFNLPAMEAMACRTPVVSTKTGWPEEAIQDGINGYLVDVNDHKDLADNAIRILLLDNESWTKMSDSALVTATNSSWADSARRFEEILKKCINFNLTINNQN